MKLFLTGIFLIVLYGCNDNDFNIHSDMPKIQEYHPSTMFYPSPYLADSNKVKLVYDKDNEISGRIGFLIQAGFMYKFYEFIADNVKYYEDSIVITKQLLSTQDFDYLDEYKRKLILENGTITKEITYKDFYNEYNYDTLYYSYNNEMKLDEIFHILSYSNRKTSNFIYYDNGNLNLIISKKWRIGFPQNTTIDTLWFLDYDNSPNLVKNLNIFQECFYRSLSTNNFRRYIHKSYNVFDSLLISTEEKSWDLTYDENNYPIY